MEKLKNEATAVRSRAYNPYSQFAVGASIKTQKGLIFSGCNVENSSYGATVCAERVAIFSAVASGALPGEKIIEVYVLTESEPPCAPCGICRQVIAEFAHPECKIHVSNTRGETRTFRFDELLPHAFTPQHLRSGQNHGEKSRA